MTSSRIGFICVRQGIRLVGGFLGRASGPIFAQRLFRSYRVLQLHSRLWSSNFAKFAQRNGIHCNPHSKKWLVSFVIYSLCQPKMPHITDSELVEHMQDLDFIHELTTATVVCPNCKDRIVIDKPVPNIKYCHCPGQGKAYNKKVEGYNWTPFVETPDLLIWRQPHPDKPELFIYKVYGYYNDISSKDFLATQLDLVYRRKWDNNVIELESIEDDPKTQSMVIYWEMKWPKMFSNRDYVFARRHVSSDNGKNVVIMSKAITHSKKPEKKGDFRVKEYWSVMVIQSVKGAEEPGVEFGLTYFDNPGLSLPGWMSNWAAMTGIPDFLNQQRNATRARRKLPISPVSIVKNSDQGEEDNKSDLKTNNEVNDPTKSDLNNNNKVDPIAYEEKSLLT